MSECQHHEYCDDCGSQAYCARNLRCKLMECPTCGGRGSVNPLTAPAGFFCTSTTDCPACDGTGEMP